LNRKLHQKFIVLEFFVNKIKLYFTLLYYAHKNFLKTTKKPIRQIALPKQELDKLNISFREYVRCNLGNSSPLWKTVVCLSLDLSIKIKDK